MHGSGVAPYIHQNVQFVLREDLICEEFESVTVQITNGKFKPFFVTSIYRPPGKPVSYFSELEPLFGRLESQNKGSIIMGDINCDLNTPLDNNNQAFK